MAVEGLSYLPALCPDSHREEIRHTVLVELVKVMQVPSKAAGAVALTAIRRCIQPVANETEAATAARESTTLAGVLAVLEALKIPDCPNPKPLLLSLAVFLFSCPRAVWSADVEAGCINVLNERCVDTSDQAIQQTAIQVVNSIIKLPDISVAVYVRQLCPSVLGMLLTAPASPPTTELELGVLREALSTASTLLAVVGEDKRSGMLAVVVSTCVGLLNTASTGVPRQLHAIALDLLKKVGLLSSFLFILLRLF